MGVAPASTADMADASGNLRNAKPENIPANGANSGR
jgi:hypothetical protein